MKWFRRLWTSFVASDADQALRSAADQIRKSPALQQRLRPLTHSARYTNSSQGFFSIFARATPVLAVLVALIALVWVTRVDVASNNQAEVEPSAPSTEEVRQLARDTMAMRHSLKQIADDHKNSRTSIRLELQAIFDRRVSEDWELLLSVKDRFQ